MRSLCTLFLVVTLPLSSYPQNPSQNVFNVAGTDVAIGQDVISASIGEPAIITLASDKSILTQGFLQPELLPCVDIQFRYYPNPAKDIITIEAFGCEVQIVSLQVIDMWGRVLATETRSKNDELDLGSVSPGVYFIKVTMSNGEVRTVNVVKIH